MYDLFNPKSAGEHGTASEEPDPAPAGSGQEGALRLWTLRNVRAHVVRGSQRTAAAAVPAAGQGQEGIRQNGPSP